MSSVSGGKNKNLVMVRRSVPRSKQVLITVLPVVLCVLLSLPTGSFAKKEKVDADKDGNNGTLPKSSTDQEDVPSRKKVVFSTESDDYWVGSHSMDFKPHPRLFPSTLAPTAQIPIPIIELGLPPTLTPDGLSDEDSSEEEKKKGGRRKSRDRRKKSRDQRRLTHRTLWANASSNNNAYIMRALQQNPTMLQQQSAYQYSNNLRQPVILTAGGMAQSMQSPPFIMNPANRNDESFHGSASTWNINHPNNNLQSYYSQGGSIGGGENTQETRYVQGYPRSNSMQNFQFGYPQIQQQQRQQAPQHFSLQQQLSSSPQSYPMSLSDQDSEIIFGSPQQQLSQTASLGGGLNGNGNGGGPIVVYVTPSGRQIAQTSGSGPIPLKAFSNINDIPVDVGLKPQLHYNYIGGHSGGHVSHSPTQSGNNPQYMRNNFLRMVMDKLANVGKVLPIPFVTKYSHSPQGYGRSSHLNRRM